MTLAPGTRQSAYPVAQGLYDPAYEHDACGVAFVATLTGVPATPSWRRAWRRCATSTIAAPPVPIRRTGDGAGILHAGAGRVPARAEAGFELPRAGSVRRRQRLPADRRVGRDAGQGDDRADRGRGEPRRFSAGAWCRPTTRSLSDVTRGNMPFFQQLFVAAKGQPLQGHRAGAAGVLPAAAGPARGRRLLRVAVVSHPGLQGHADHRAARAGLPRAGRRADGQRAGGRALPVLDQHLPGLGAGPPVPDDRPQRRDQHRQGQPELDAGARGAAEVATSSPATWSGCSRSARRTRPTPPRSTRSSSCCTWPAARCRTRC